MKKITLFILTLFATMAVYANQVNISWNSPSDWSGVDEAEKVISYTSNGISITVDQAGGGTKPTVNANANDCRAYANNTVRMISSIGNMSKIVFNISAQGLRRLPDVTPSVGSIAIDASAATITWTGDANDITLTVGEKAVHGTDGASKAGQFDFTSIDVTISGSAPSVSMPMFSVNSGTYYEPIEVEISCSTEGADIYYTVDGTTPDASKQLYSEAITIGETTTVKAIAVKGNDVSSINEATYTINAIPEVADIAAFLATNTTEAAKTDLYRIACPVTVIYQYDRYMYITDGTSSLQVYGSLNKEYANGDVLEGVCGSVGYYNGTYQMTPYVSSFGEATPGAPVYPKEVAIADITADMVSQYVKLDNVMVKTEKIFTDETGSIDAYKRFDVELPAVGNDSYSIEGFVSIYKTTIQIFPTKVTVTTALNNVQSTANRVFAANGYIKTSGNNETVSVYNVTGKLVATGIAGRDIKVDSKGIYIVKVGNKATKVVVR